VQLSFIRLAGTQGAGGDAVILEGAILDGCGSAVGVAIDDRVARKSKLGTLRHRGATRKTKEGQSYGGGQDARKKIKAIYHRRESR